MRALVLLTAFLLSLASPARAADDVAATHDDRELGVVLGFHRDDVLGDFIDDIRIDPKGSFSSEALAPQLEEHPFVARQGRRFDHCMTWLD